MRESAGKQRAHTLTGYAPLCGVFFVGPVGSQLPMRLNPSFNDACSVESLLDAYRFARNAGRYRTETLAFGYKLEENILALHTDLMTGMYRHGNYRQFVVVDAKKRNIKAACFRDRIVRQAVFRALGPVFESGFIFDS